MAALGFKFREPSRAVDYWLDLLRQENPHLRKWLIPRLCFASAEFCLELETRALEAGTSEKAAPVRNHGESSPDRGTKSDFQPLGDVAADEVSRQQNLLLEYKNATDGPSSRRIYNARNSGIHKPEFYEWLRGELPNTSQTAISFERFLAEKKPPIPRNPKD